MKRIIGILLLVTLIAGLAGCGRNPLIGRWENVNSVGQVLELSADGNGVCARQGVFTWTSSNGQLRIVYVDGTIVTWDYEITGATLDLEREHEIDGLAVTVIDSFRRAD